jgi:hypothetical protein
MKKLVSIFAVAALFSLSASAQGILDKLGSLGNVISNAAGVVYSAPVSLNGTYSYNGVAVSATSSEGGILTNLAGSAATSALESKADGYLSKVGIKPGAMSFTFNSSDNTFTLNVAGISIPGTYKVGDGEKTVSLTFGKKMQYFSLTGSLESSLSGARMVFPVNKAVTLFKKVASAIGQSSSSLGSLASLADGYDNFRLGFKMSK